MKRGKAAISPSRSVAARALVRVFQDPAAQANEAVTALATAEGLRADDARLARSLVMGVLRHSLTLDYGYAEFLKQPAHKLDALLRLALQMAAFQQWYLDKIPPHAIVNETMEVARQIYKLQPRQLGFLNAILRRIVEREHLPALPEGNRARELATRFSYPDEVVRLLVESYGTHKAVAIMEACNQEAPLVLRVNLLKTSREQLAGELASLNYETRVGGLSPEALEIVSHAPDAAPLFESEPFRQGEFYAQDEASQLIAHIVQPAAGERILDFCSAPGGKTTHLAELCGGACAITATDASSSRLELVHENLRRLGSPGISVVAQDELLQSAATYDALLVDAPCSGMGTMRRNPEIRYRVTTEALQRQAARQMEVLRQAIPFVATGGRLIYSTCSVSKVENENVVRELLKEHPDFELVTEPVEGPAAALFCSDGYYRTWPAHPQADGFVAAVLRRTS